MTEHWMCEMGHRIISSTQPETCPAPFHPDGRIAAAGEGEPCGSPIEWQLVPVDEEESATMTTIKRADGELIWGEFGWVTDQEFFDDLDEPLELVEEIWVRQSTRQIWKLPTFVYACQFEDCDEDAESWVQLPDGQWLQACTQHLGTVPQRSPTER